MHNALAAVAPRHTGQSHRQSEAGSLGSAAGSKAEHELHFLGRVCVALLLIAAVSVALASVSIRPDYPKPDGWMTVSVDPNGTLWGLAAAYPVEGLDTASTVDLIRSENGLASSALFPGQTLKVPASGMTDTAMASR